MSWRKCSCVPGTGPVGREAAAPESRCSAARAGVRQAPPSCTPRARARWRQSRQGRSSACLFLLLVDVVFGRPGSR
jgi:hypothetical protein